MSLTIERVEILPLRFEMRRRVANAKATWQERTGFVVRLHGGGAVGEGEASPLPGFSQDTLADAKAALTTASAALRGVSLDEHDAVLVGAGARSPAARFALETAALDLRARLHGVPAWRELACDSALTPVPIPISSLLASETAGGLVDEAKLALARGISTVKLKVGRPQQLEIEVDRVRILRETFGSSLAIRLDANGAWTVDEAWRALDRLAPFTPELIEEPVSGARWQDLASRPSAVPLAMDETIALPDGARILDELLDRRVLAAVVIKLSNVGGFTTGAALVRRVRTAGATVVVTHMFEGAIGTAAAASFALAHGSTHAVGLDVRAYLDLAEGHLIGLAAVSPSSRLGIGI